MLERVQSVQLAQKNYLSGIKERRIGKKHY